MATEGQSEYESVLCVKPEVNVYRIPPRASNRAIRWGCGPGGPGGGRRPDGGERPHPASGRWEPSSRRLTSRAHPLITQPHATGCSWAGGLLCLQGHGGKQASHWGVGGMEGGGAPAPGPRIRCSRVTAPVFTCLRPMAPQRGDRVKSTVSYRESPFYLWTVESHRLQVEVPLHLPCSRALQQGWWCLGPRGGHARSNWKKHYCCVRLCFAAVCFSHFVLMKWPWCRRCLFGVGVVLPSSHWLLRPAAAWERTSLTPNSSTGPPPPVPPRTRHTIG